MVRVRTFRAVVAAACVLTATVWATPAWASFLPNGDFERSGVSLAGWTGDGARLALRTDGGGGGHAARVTRRPHNPSCGARAPLTPATSVAGATYRARGFVRSAAHHRTVCLKVLEITPAGSAVDAICAWRADTPRWRGASG